MVRLLGWWPLNKLFLPLSFYGSFWAVHINDDHTIGLRDTRGGDEKWGELFKMRFEKPELMHFKLSETVMTLCEGDDVIGQITFVDADTLRVQWYQEPLSIEFNAGRYDHVTFLEDYLEATHYDSQIKVALKSPNGKFMVPSKTLIKVEGAPAVDVYFESYKVVPKANAYIMRPFDEQVHLNNEQLQTFYQCKNASELEQSSAFVLWRNMVNPEGHLKYPTLYMSKNDMNNIWSWDHYFSALGLSHIHPELAYQQLLAFEHVQDVSGAFPDYLNDQFASYNCVKPPLLGWTYLSLMKRDAFFSEKSRLKRIVRMCEKQMKFYDTYRKCNKGGYYYKHGNDSGWDNASVFASGQAVVSPDLLTYLITLNDFLGEAYKLLGEDEHSEASKKLSNHLVDQLLTQFWDEHSNCFIARDLQYFEPIRTGDSLLMCMPLLVGKHLPSNVIDALLHALKSFECPFGFATENPNSPYYKYNGYWLGPVWAPTMCLLVSAIEAFDKVWATALRTKFLHAVSVGGYAENFDPFTGEGLVDYGFAWTAAVTLEFIKNV